MKGRKTKLTPEVFQRIVDLVRAGNFLDTAAESCGVHRSTLHRWLEKGEQQSRGTCREFYLAVMRARSDAEVRDVLLIAQASPKDWRAAAWRLERRSPRRYGKQVQASVREEVNSLVAHLEKKLPKEAFHLVLRALDDEEDQGDQSRHSSSDGTPLVRPELETLVERLARRPDVVEKIVRASNDDEDGGAQNS